MISAVIVLLATFALGSASSLAERQSECTTVAVPQNCTQSLADYHVRKAQILANASSITAEQSRAILVPYLNTLCGSTCLDPTLNNFRCARRTDIVKFVLTGPCGNNGNESCLLQFVDLAIDGINPIQPCPSSGTCTSSCRNTLITIVNRLGCCAASWYANSASPYASVANQYRTCGVSLGSVCAAATGAGSTIVHLSVMLMYVTSALAIFIL